MLRASTNGPERSPQQSIIRCRQAACVGNAPPISVSVKETKSNGLICGDERCSISIASADVQSTHPQPKQRGPERCHREKEGKEQRERKGREEGGKDGTLPCMLRELLDSAHAAWTALGTARRHRGSS